MSEPAKKSRFPDSLVLIFSMIVLAQLLTYVLPHGVYDQETVNGKERVVNGTYHVLEGEAAVQLSWHAFLTSIPKGLEEAQDIIFLVFLVGGVIAVLRRTGAVDAFLFAVVRKIGGKPWLLLGGCLLVFGAGAFFIGMGEEYMPLIPIIVTMCLAMKMDTIVAMGLVWTPYAVGWACAGLNPFGVLIAQDLAGLEPTSGLGFRFVLLFLFLAVTYHHLYRYAMRIKANPELSYVAGVDLGKRFDVPSDTEMTGRRWGVLAAFVIGLALFIWGAKYHGWYIYKLNAVFLGIGIVAAILGRLSPNETSKTFIDGAAEMTAAALLVGFARTIQVVLEDGQIIHTVVNSIASALDGAGAEVAAVGMLAVQCVCNFFVPSGSGQAYMTMPIMSPIATLTGVPQQTAVLAYQFGDGFTNMIVPTSALVMGTLALGGIPYGKWVKFVAPLLVKLLLLAIAVLVFTVRFPELIGFE